MNRSHLFSILAVALILFLGLAGGFSQPAQAASAGYSLRFYGHGSGDIDRVKIRIDAPPVPADVGGNFTIEFWLKAGLADNASPACQPGDDNWINGNIIIDRDVYGNGDYGDYGISLANGRIAFGVSRGGRSQTICGAANVANRKWHHIAVTRSSATGQMRIFVDGKLDRSGTGPTGNISYRNRRATSHPNSDPFLVLGAEKHDAGAAYPSYSGFLDELRISKNVRYSGNFTRPRTPFIADSNTVALYHFDEGPAGMCAGDILDSSTAGKSGGQCRFGGSAPAGPLYSNATPFQAATPTPRPLAERVLIVSFDGLRPDAISAAPMPNLSGLMGSGAYTLTAQTIYPSETLPAHASMLSGLCPSQHGVLWNDYIPDNGYALGVNLFDAVHPFGLRTVMVVGKEKLRQVAEPENVDVFIYEEGGEVEIVNDALAEMANGFGVMFVHFPSGDVIGHEFGWMSEEQLNTFAFVDSEFGELLEGLYAYGLHSTTLIIATSDHGGHDFTHGTDLPEDMTIPWIVSGPGVIPGPLASYVHTTDTAASAVFMLNLPLPAEWVGRPVNEAFGQPIVPRVDEVCPQTP